MPSVLLRRLRHGHLRSVEHIFDEDSVARGGIIDEHVGDGSDELAVLDYRRSRHECGQVGTTKFTKKCF